MGSQRPFRVSNVTASAASGATSDEGNVATRDAEIGQLAIGEAVELVAGVADAVPVADGSEDIHWALTEFSCLR